MHVPQSRFELPETLGQGKVGLEIARVYDEYAVTFTENSELYPVDTRTPTVGKIGPDSSAGSNDDIRFAGRYAFVDQLEVFYKTEGEFLTGIKYQFLGKPKFESRPGDFSSSVTLGYGRLDDEDEEYDERSIRSKYWDYSILGGYRISDWVLIYSSLFYTSYNYKIEVEPFAINQFQERFKGDADVTGINLGINVDIFRQWSLTFEAVQSEIETGDVSERDTFYGINLRNSF